MNKDNAKDFLPLVQALAEGKTIQIMTADRGWVDFYKEIVFSLSAKYYRIKPVPTKAWINIYSNSLQTQLFYARQLADDYAHSDRIACIEIAFYEGEGL